MSLFDPRPNFSPRPPAEPYNPSTTTYDYTDNLSLGGSFLSVPPLWLLQVIGPDPQQPQFDPNGLYLAYPSFGGSVGTGYMLDASQWNCQGTNVMSEFGILTNPAFSFGCTLPLTISVTPAWEW